MRRGLLAGLLLILLAAPAAQAAPWLQPRGDAAATGFQPDEGPAWKDVALEVELPADLTVRRMPPLVLEDRVLFPAQETTAYAHDWIGEAPQQLVSVDLDTGNVSTLPVPSPGDRYAEPLQGRMATDGETLYLTGNRTVHAIPLEPAGNEWTWEWEPRTQPGAHADCIGMSLEGDHLSVICREIWEDDRQTSDALRDEYVTLAARLDAATGEPAWTWQRPPPPNSDQQTEPASTYAVPVGIAAAGPVVIVQTLEVAFPYAGASPAPADTQASAGSGEARYAVWALERGSGELVWNWTSPEFQGFEVAPSPVELPTEWPRLLSGNPAASDQAVYVKANGVYKLTLGSGEQLWERSIGEEDFETSQSHIGAAGLAGDHVFATSAQTVYRMGAERPENGWSTTIDLSGGAGFDTDPIVGAERVYGAAETSGRAVHEEVGSVYAFDRDDGDLVWKKSPHDVASFAVADGLLAYTRARFDGTELVAGSLTVLGQTQASPTPSAEISSAYPALGETVRVDLSGSEAGAQGPVTRYKAIWGDGNTTGWQSDPVLTHRYSEPGNVTARFVVGNEANQTNSTTRTFHVGQQAPTEPNLVEEAFQRENQDLTFGVLGIAVALGGGAVGVVRRKRKQATLQEELETLEEGFEELQDTPSECEPFLDNRKARARSLALDGHLDEEQAAIVETRAEELRAQLRLDAVEEEFAFLPHGLVTKAREMVEDGEITSLERDGFLTALEDSEVITDEQEALVRRRIEDWFGRDAGGGPG